MFWSSRRIPLTFIYLQLLIVTKEHLNVRQPSIATDLEALLDGVNLLDILRAQLKVVQLKVALDPGLGNTLGQNTPALLDTPSKQHLLRRLAVGLSNLQQRLVLVQRRVGAAQRRVASAMNTLLLAVRNKLGRGVARVQLDLVDSWDNLEQPVSNLHPPWFRERETYLAARVIQQPLQILNRKVTDTDILHLARTDKLLHLPPCIDEIPILISLAHIIRVRRTGPVHEIQVDIIRPQGLEGILNSLRNALMPWVVELGRQPDLGPGDAGVFDAVADFLLVAVGRGCVDVPVSGLQGIADGVADFVGLGLPCSQTDGGDGGAGV